MLKKKLVEAPVLGLNYYKDEVELHTDASAQGFGGSFAAKKRG